MSEERALKRPRLMDASSELPTDTKEDQRQVRRFLVDDKQAQNRTEQEKEPKSAVSHIDKDCENSSVSYRIRPSDCVIICSISI